MDSLTTNSKGKTRTWGTVALYLWTVGSSRSGILALLLLTVYGGVRVASYRTNNKALVPAPINGIARECPKPTYPLLVEAVAASEASTTRTTAAQGESPVPPVTLQPHEICLTTLTDEKKADFIQRMVRWRNFGSLLEMTWSNKEAYAKKHGYRLFDESDHLDVTRPPSWSKIRAAQRLLKEENCTWVFWIDADTVIMNSDKRIQDFLPRDHDLILTEQKGHSWNAGAWLIRNTEWSRNYLDHWWNMKTFVQPKGLAHSGDNHAMKHFLTGMDPTEFQQHIVVPARCQFNSVTVFLSPNDAESFRAHPETVKKQWWYMHSEKYHKGDLVAHIAGIDNKIDTAEMLLKDAK